MARCAEISRAAIPLFCVMRMPVTLPSRRSVNVTPTTGALLARTSVVFQYCATRVRRRSAYAPNWLPNGELLPTPTPPPPARAKSGVLTLVPAVLYTWFCRSFWEARHLSGTTAAGDGRFSLASRLGMGMAFGSGRVTFGEGLALETGTGTSDLVSVAT